MREHQTCPECGSYDIEVVHTEWFTDYVERTKICNDCPAEFTVSYGDPQIIDVTMWD